jgi:hypothetical protein
MKGKKASKIDEKKCSEKNQEIIYLNKIFNFQLSIFLSIFSEISLELLKIFLRANFLYFFYQHFVKFKIIFFVKIKKLKNIVKKKEN